MAIKNISNYKIGQKFIMDVCGISKCPVEIIDKEPGFLKLSCPSVGIIKEDWYDKNDLTIVKSLNRNKPASKVNTIEQPKPIVQIDLQKPDSKFLASKPTVSILPNPFAKVELKKEQSSTLLLASILDIDKSILHDNAEEQKYLVQCIRRDLRLILKKHGYIAPIEMKLPQILGMIDAHLKNR